MLFITLPMLGPMLIFTFITSIISAFQQLTKRFCNEGRPSRIHLFLAMYIYDNAFKYFGHGYAGRGVLGDVRDRADISLVVMPLVRRMGLLRGASPAADGDAMRKTVLMRR